VRALTIGVLVTCATACAQIVVDERRLGSTLAKFESSEPDSLRCSVSPIHPSLNYSFRFQAGYIVTVPMEQFEGTGHRWRMITRITPEEGERRPVYLVAGYGLPPVPKTKQEVQIGGGYLMGEGIYTVRHLLIDERGRTCRKDWRVDVRPGRGESKVKTAIPPGTVWDVSLRGARLVPPPDIDGATDDAASLRLTIMLHAAPTFPRRTRLRQNDIMMLLASVTSLLEHVPVRSVRLIAFNLDQQRELYRKDGFQLRNMPEVAEAMNRTELGLVDAKVLQNRRGHLDVIADLVNQEVKAPEPSDIVLFLGPVSRYFEKVSQEALEKPEGRGPQFLFFQLVPAFRGGRGGMLPPPVLPDSIRHAVARVGGKTLVIRTPGDLAKAIDRLEKSARQPLAR
jgi:hypothetical protein